MSRLSKSEAYEYVCRGAALLDVAAEAPGAILPKNWREQLDTSRLDLAATWHDVLGQLFAAEFTDFRDDEGFTAVSPYEYGCDQLDTWANNEYNSTMPCLEGHGLVTCGRDAIEETVNYATLTAAWKEYLS